MGGVKKKKKEWEEAGSERQAWGREVELWERGRYIITYIMIIRGL